MIAIHYQPQEAFALLRCDRTLEVAYVVARSKYPMCVDAIRSSISGGHLITRRWIRHMVTRLSRAGLLGYETGRFGRYEYQAKPRLREILRAGGVTRTTFSGAVAGSGTGSEFPEDHFAPLPADFFESLCDVGVSA